MLPISYMKHRCLLNDIRVPGLYKHGLPCLVPSSYRHEVTGIKIKYFSLSYIYWYTPALGPLTIKSAIKTAPDSVLI